LVNATVPGVRTVAVVVSLLVAFAGVARAEDMVAYEVEGDAPVAAGDSRGAAVDDGFAHAVLAALAELVPPEARAARKADLEREIVGHARLWVAKFSVTRDETNDDRRQLELSVKIDRDKLRARLTELGIATATNEPPPAADTGHPALVLLAVTTPNGTRVSFGDGAIKDLPGAAQLASALRAAGMRVAQSQSHGGPPSGGTSGDLPLADDAAVAAGNEAGAEVVVIAGVTVGASQPVRGVPAAAALVTAHVRVLDVRSRNAADGIAAAAARGDGDASQGLAIEHALSGALSDALPAPARAVARAAQYVGDDTPVPESGIVSVRLPAKTPWALVVSEQKYLAGARGVRSATLRRLSPGGWAIGVATNETVERVADIARKSPATDTQASVRIAGQVVEVTLSGAP
jgi:hypothetical protein